MATGTNSTPPTLALPGGRRLAWAEFGDPQGRPLVYFHGFPGSRLDGRLLDELAARRGVRVIVMERPGFGYSDFEPCRRKTDWPDDVAALADHLGLDRFSVVGASAGGPYALACALRLPERLERVGVICGMGPTDDFRHSRGMLPFNRWGLRLVRHAPWLCLPSLRCATPIFRHATGPLIDHLARQTTAPDRRFFARPAYRQIFVDTFREAFRQGARGPAWDVCLMSRPWELPLDRIRIRVHLWHGESDVVVPAAMGRHVAAAIPDVVARFYPDEGHFSLALGRSEEILEQLLT